MLGTGRDLFPSPEGVPGNMSVVRHALASVARQGSHVFLLIKGSTPAIG